MRDQDHTHIAERIILATGGQERELRRTTAEIGFHEVCRVLLDEVLFRCDVSNSEPVVVELEITDGAALVRYPIALVRGRRPEVADDPGHSPEARFSFDVVDLANELFGPRRSRGAAARRSELTSSSPFSGGRLDIDAARRMASVHRAISALAEACSGGSSSLNALAIRYGTDKWGGLHWYTPHYERHFADLRDEPVRLLEIGIGGYDVDGFGGGSLKMWKRYFRRGLVHGLDIYDKSFLDGTRIRTLRGDQNDPAYLTAIAEEMGPFDIVVDDGSHVGEHQLTSFHALFPHIRPGGFYVIEDLHTSYWPEYGGTDAPVRGSGTALGLLTQLLDGLHYEERGDSGGVPLPGVDDRTVALHVYRNIAFVEKGVNAEGGIPLWTKAPSQSVAAATTAR
ncbi:demethylmacrocin O-methyltransferase [Saccharopolyspora erythraea NRRL 2338]|uniref:Class I SAM-dependent methyltransferase n=1 Tax=Saccharopolyspora erythraea TaxID=1836 RepID=A0ABN1DXM7_SACER|nr:class I SAM-dependent methyltransferase [Saccharopolyspora erythraea]EQD84822.1 methyltransferase [Saccharopolyspora erythraea D]PFG93799.1 demethylmacrocin O-methyltransferase [Saccharopolyspora erythraea NRRL 2338]QRK90635.1 class I SAM-dependent methyltransferase [Saccharopolyspora erythraea]